MLNKFFRGVEFFAKCMQRVHSEDAAELVVETMKLGFSNSFSLRANVAACRLSYRMGYDFGAKVKGPLSAAHQYQCGVQQGFETWQLGRPMPGSADPWAGSSYGYGVWVGFEILPKLVGPIQRIHNTMRGDDRFKGLGAVGANKASQPVSAFWH